MRIPYTILSMLAARAVLAFNSPEANVRTSKPTRKPARKKIDTGGIPATQADLLGKSHGKQSKRAKRRKGGAA